MKRAGIPVGRYEIKEGRLVQKKPRCVSKRIAVAKAKKKRYKPARK